MYLVIPPRSWIKALDADVWIMLRAHLEMQQIVETIANCDLTLYVPIAHAR